MRSLALFGGSFDPLHKAHLAIMDEITQFASFDEIHFILSAQQPLKMDGENSGHEVSAEHRLSMLKAGLNSRDHYIASDIELERLRLQGKPSYAFDTLRAFQRKNTEAAITFIMGADSLLTFDQWHRASELLTLANFLVIARPGYAFSFPNVWTQLENWNERQVLLPALTQQSNGAVAIYDAAEYDVSSTKLRKLLAICRERALDEPQQRYLDNNLPLAVRDYIFQNDLY